MVTNFILQARQAIEEELAINNFTIPEPDDSHDDMWHLLHENAETDNSQKQLEVSLLLVLLSN